MFSGSSLGSVALASLDAFSISFILIDSSLVAGARGWLEKAVVGRPALSWALTQTECYGCLSFHLGWALLAPMYEVEGLWPRVFFGLKLIGPVFLMDFALSAMDRVRSKT